MAKLRTIQILRGTTAQNNAYTGSAGELTMDTTTNELRVHDGSTAGGHKIGTKIDNATITKNASDEIQAVATINANTATGATNPIYDWVGTLEEYNNATPMYCWSTDFVKLYTTTDTPTTSDRCYLTKTMSMTIDAVGTNTITAGGWTYTRVSTQDTYWDVAFGHPDWICFITDDIGGPATEIGEITEALNNKVDKGHQVVEFQEPTAANNYTWYRKYADGWVEQGGRSTGLDRTITLPVTMSNANYVIITDLVGAISWAGYSHAVQNITTTGFRCWYDGDSTDPSNWSWQVSGMAA